jgi:hypothetical protein
VEVVTLDIATLRALLAAATPGPWRNGLGGIVQLSDGGKGYPLDYYPDCADVVTTDGADARVATEPDLDLICAAVNALPTLLDEVERLRAVESDFNDTIDSCPPSGRQLIEVYEIARRIVDEGCCTCRQTMSCLVCKEILKLERIFDAVDAARKERT